MVFHGTMVLELTPFHGRLMVQTKGVRDEQIPNGVRAGVSPATRRAGGCGRSANDVAKEFGLHATTVAKWVRLRPMGTPAAAPLAKSNVPQGPLNVAKRQGLVELRRKLRQVQIERDILAKATAWFAGKSEKTSTTFIGS